MNKLFTRVDFRANEKIWANWELWFRLISIWLCLPSPPCFPCNFCSRPVFPATNKRHSFFALKSHKSTCSIGNIQSIRWPYWLLRKHEISSFLVCGFISPLTDRGYEQVPDQFGMPWFDCGLLVSRPRSQGNQQCFSNQVRPWIILCRFMLLYVSENLVSTELMRFRLPP